MLKKKAVSLLKNAVAIIGGLYLVGYMLVQPYLVPSPSMVPTLLPGDRILADKRAYGLRVPILDKVLFRSTPDRGDVVVFRYPADPSMTFVKRIVAVPGDTVEVVDGVLLVNGDKSPYQGILGEAADAKGRNYQKTKIPEGHLFAMGDNRDFSTDSRFWGFVPEEDILGRPFLIYWSSGQGMGVPRWERIGSAID